jgi:hypothetical protein
VSGEMSEGEETAGAADDAAAAVAASGAAKRALAFAPSNQRSFHKELSTVLKACDILLEVLDARDPMGCRCKALEDAVLSKCKGKRVVLVLNKVDLVPAEVTQKWLSYLRQYFPTLPFKATTQGKRDPSSSAQSSAVGKLSSYGAEAYGGDGLLQLLKNYSRSIGLKTAITVGIVGYPNVRVPTHHADERRMHLAHGTLVRERPRACGSRLVGAVLHCGASRCECGAWRVLTACCCCLYVAMALTRY